MLLLAVCLLHTAASSFAVEAFGTGCCNVASDMQSYIDTVNSCRW